MNEGLTDPVLRCATCGKLLTRKTIKTIGCCTKCGMKRVATVQFMTDEEKTDLAGRGISQSWLDEFCKEVPDE